MMGYPSRQVLLTTKLNIPHSPGKLEERPRLVERLNTGTQGPLTLVSAAAGFGKTTALTEWAAQSSLPVAWLSLDEADSDHTRFLSYLIAALQRVLPGVGEAVQGMLSAPQQPLINVLLSNLINEIAGLEKDIVLVLDDCHRINGREVHQTPGFLTGKPARPAPSGNCRARRPAAPPFPAACPAKTN